MTTKASNSSRSDWLYHYEGVFNDSAAVLGHVLLDEAGNLLSKNVESLGHGIDLPELTSWMQNSTHALETYYPKADDIFLRYHTYNVIINRSRNMICCVILDNSYEVPSFEALITGEQLKRLASKLTNKSKKETVFMKVSDGKGSRAPMPAGNTPAPMPAPQTAPATPSAASEKKSNTGVIIIVAIVVLAALGGVFAMMGGSKQDAPATSSPAPTAATAQPVRDAAYYKREALVAKNDAESVRKAAREADASEIAVNEYARAVSTFRNAESSFAQEDFQLAKKLFQDSEVQFGESLVATTKRHYDQAISDIGIENARDYNASLWARVDALTQDAQQLISEGKYAQAADKYSEAAKIIPEMHSAMFEEVLRLAKDAADNGDKTLAEHYYKQVLELDPENKAALHYIYRNAYRPGQTIEQPYGFTLTFIPAGSYLRGSPASERYRDADEAQHEVTLSESFFMATTEVTQAQWAAVMGQPFTMPETKPSFIGAELPVHNVSWFQAEAFCQKLSELTGETYRLPTEAEWEYAARAGTVTPYNTGNEQLTAADANVYDPAGDVIDHPLPVATVGKANAWGLYDMHGNVWEWTQDWAGPYPTAAVSDPKGASEDSFSRVDLATKILRGGSFYDEADLARSANRFENSPSVGTDYIGFRVVMELPGDNQ